MNDIFYEILILIKNVNINVRYFRIITNQNSHIYLLKITKNYNINSYIFNDINNNHYFIFLKESTSHYHMKSCLSLYLR